MTSHNRRNSAAFKPPPKRRSPQFTPAAVAPLCQTAATITLFQICRPCCAMLKSFADAIDALCRDTPDDIQRDAERRCDGSAMEDTPATASKQRHDVGADTPCFSPAARCRHRARAMFFARPAAASPLFFFFFFVIVRHHYASTLSFCHSAFRWRQRA